MHNLNGSTIEWNDEQFWIKFAYYGQFGFLQKRPNISIDNTNDTDHINQVEKIKLIDITFLVLVIFTIVFVFVTLTVKVLCQRLSEKDIDIDIEYLQTLSKNIAPSRTIPVVSVSKPVSKSVNKSVNKFISQSFSLPSQKTGPMSLPVQSSSSTSSQLIDQDKSSSDLRLNVSTLEGKISFNPSKQSVISPVHQSKYGTVTGTGTEKISFYSKSLPEASQISKRSLDIHSTNPLSSGSFDNHSDEVTRRMSLGLSREDFISVLSDRDSIEMDIKSLRLRSNKSKITSGLLQNSRQADSNLNISHSSFQDNIEKSSYQIEKSKPLSVKKQTRVAFSEVHRDSYPVYSRISKLSKSPKSHGEIQSRALSELEYKSVSLKTHKPRGSWKSTQSIVKNVKHDSSKHAN